MPKQLQVATKGISHSAEFFGHTDENLIYKHSDMQFGDISVNVVLWPLSHPFHFSKQQVATKNLQTK